MRRLVLAVYPLALLLACAAPGCGGASGIEEGVPKNTEIPAGFDPGGDAKPDMSGKKAPGKASPVP